MLGSVIVSGFVSILFGRNRSSEDIDLLLKKIDYASFQKLWKKINKKFVCINVQDVKSAFHDYLAKNIALRFSKKNSFIPNMELRFVKSDLEE